MRYMSRRHKIAHRRHMRNNPDESLPKEAGMTVVASIVGIAGAIALEKAVSGMSKEGAVPAGSPEGSKLARYSDNQVSAITAGVCALVGVGLHVKNIAPRVGKALIAGGGALAVSRYMAHKTDTADQQAQRIAGARGIETAPVFVSQGIETAPVFVSQGAYGYLPSSSGAVGPQYGIVPSGAAVGAQYGTMVR